MLAHFVGTESRAHKMAAENKWCTKRAANLRQNAHKLTTNCLRSLVTLLLLLLLFFVTRQLYERCSKQRQLEVSCSKFSGVYALYFSALANTHIHARIHTELDSCTHI